MPLHPSVDLLRPHLIPSCFEIKLTFINFNKSPLLAFSNDCAHLLRLNVLDLSPLTNTCSVLAWRVIIFILAHEKSRLLFSKTSNILSCKAKLVLNLLLDLYQR